MEANYSFSSYPDSQNSSPRSREIDCDGAPWPDDSAAPPGGGYRVKFICSYGGKIQPRSHDNQLSYVGGDTKILAVDRNIRLTALLARLATLSAAESSVEFTVKYQLPGEDLDALISVTNEEDLDHLMAEYDRLVRLSPKPARMRLFLFPVSPTAAVAPVAAKPDSKWLVDAFNSAPIQAAMESGPPVEGNPDFLFGLDKGYDPPVVPPVTTTTAAAAAARSKVSDLEVAEVETPVGSDLEKEDQQVGGGEAAPAEIQRQIQDMQRMQIAGGPEQAAFTARAEYYAPQPPPLEKVMPAPSVAASIPSTVPTAYWTDRQPIPASSGGFPTVTAADQQPVFFIPASGPPPHGVYSGIRQVTGQVGQGYYTVQRMMQQPEVYHRDSSTAAMYGMAPMGPPPTATKMTTYTTEGGVGMVRAANPPGMVVPELVYGQMAYDSTGRPVYYTSSASGGAVVAAGGMPPTYTTVGASAVDVRQPSIEMKVGKPAAQTS